MSEKKYKEIKKGRNMSKVYSKEEREQAVKLAEETGVTAAGRKLGINHNTISGIVNNGSVAE